MREIKFRAWNEHVKDMVYSEPMPDMAFWKYVAYDNTTPFMQYTGHKDANGVEIYEGDIVKEYGLVEPLTHEVIWSQERGGYCLSNSNSRENEWTTGEYLLVIGNIYENPELLENKS